MNCCSVNGKEDHLLKLIDFLYKDVLSAGGDGDALWYSRYYKVSDIYPLVEKYNKALKFPWKLELTDMDILWHDNQESLHITNNEQTYLQAPSWQQILIKY